jgi:plasmid stability protein
VSADPDRGQGRVLLRLKTSRDACHPADAAPEPTVAFPDGTVVPDWTAVTAPSAHSALTALFAAFIGRRWHGIDSTEDEVRRAILRAYVTQGHAPAPVEIAAAVALPPGDVAAALHRLAGRDLVVLDGDGRVSGAYPFTDAPSEHQVEAAGITMGAMCALDALGICTIAPHASLIRSSCRQCRRSLAIHVHDRGCTLGDVVPEGIRLVRSSLHRRLCSVFALHSAGFLLPCRSS